MRFSKAKGRGLQGAAAGKHPMPPPVGGI